ncbi:phosphodiesterase [Bacillus sp. SA1-12]|uniref:metallophosphoesterase family protein n=1 Tax=Bacillus sp. SA1-12 TaxID=1455638 RepID=UPI0006272D93|nr:metallophosphoesterase family protein [Bacillus sp. SA1-12]KKI90237.1 phosphodiesterase [Bacillus sp. SA1-12]
MKIAFISDIHGNAVALEAVLDDVKKKNIDKVCVLGDICYRGPQPKRSLDLVRSLQTEVIKGNADEWVVRGVQKGEVPDKVLGMMNTERNWTVSKLQESDLDYLKGLPEELHFDIDGIGIHAFHATPNNLFDVVLPNTDDEGIVEKLMSKANAQIYIYAHIHKPYIRFINGQVVMNIGSVGLPFDGLTKSSYGMVHINEGGFSVSIERVDFTIQKVIDQYLEGDYPNANMMINVLKEARL